MQSCKSLFDQNLYIEGINADGVGGEGTLRTMWAEDERLRGERRGGRVTIFYFPSSFSSHICLCPRSFICSSSASF